jgi:hypothetical protein
MQLEEASIAGSLGDLTIPGPINLSERRYLLSKLFEDDTVGARQVAKYYVLFFR